LQKRPIILSILLIVATPPQCISPEKDPTSRLNCDVANMYATSQLGMRYKCQFFQKFFFLSFSHDILIFSNLFLNIEETLRYHETNWKKIQYHFKKTQEKTPKTRNFFQFFHDIEETYTLQVWRDSQSGIWGGYDQ